MIPAVYDFEFLEELNRFTEKHQRKVAVHINIDTGMGRLGFSLEDAATVLKKRFSYIEVEGVYTHFAAADVPLDDYTKLQIRAFRELLSRENVQVPYRHAANSAGILNFPESHLNLVRPGLILYGISPTAEDNISQHPILSLKSRVIALRWIAKDETIGYGRTFRAERKSLIATLPFGYADGLRRELSNRLEVEVCGVMCRIAGTISMDLCMVDVTSVSDQIKLGDEVTLLGPKTTAWHWANLLNTIPYEITCLIGARVQRVYVKGGQICDVYYP
jgi:alanine racemase